MSRDRCQLKQARAHYAFCDIEGFGSSLYQYDTECYLLPKNNLALCLLYLLCLCNGCILCVMLKVCAITNIAFFPNVILIVAVLCLNMLKYSTNTCLVGLWLRFTQHSAFLAYVSQLH